MSAKDPGQEGDEEDLATFLTSHWDELYRVVRRRVGNHHVAEDIRQNAAKGFVIWWRKRQPVQTNERTPMLFSIAHRKIAGYYREGSRRPVTPMEGGPLADDATISTEEEVLAELGYRELMQVLSYLTPAQRRAFELVRVDGLKHRTAAEIMGISLSGLRKHLDAARKNLMRRIDGLSEPFNIAASRGSSHD
ncbi:RNA polymerase sigma factor [Saccharopolyspora sp. WRP15-2]|uniref:RNA polymerase sigma factor n=1 Tax=Saccharopolyspora oryzae TaxID=2997343 RepID=A0ABT4V4J0_9PSEU|nr:RNA polymerase sigma factor [Saccharopolyspora oryzae]MDA3628351.1 RNA polymerase sigma factor [Saccharopolyspora oryzae]